MKKMLVAALLAAATFSAGATKYVVLSHDALKADEVQIPCNYYAWEGTYTPENGATVDDATAPDGGAEVRTLTNKGWFGGGWESKGAEFDFTQISSGNYDMVFSIKTDLPKDLNELWIQFNNTSKGVKLQPDIRNMIVRDNEWHTYRLNLRENFANVLNSVAAGDNLYCFTFGGTSIAGKTVAISDVYFEPAEEKPAITATAQNITMNSAEIAYTVTLPENLTGAEVEVLLDGNATTASPIALTGLTTGAKYTHTLVAKATLYGKTLESAPVEVSFSTLRDPSVTPVWYGLTEKALSINGKECPLSYNFQLIANADHTLTIEFTIDGFENLPGTNITPSFAAEGKGTPNDWSNCTKVDSNTFTRTTTQTYEYDQEFAQLFIYVPFEGGADRVDIAGYTYGAANEPIGLKPSIKAEAADVTFNSAVINYTVTLPKGLEGAEVEVKLNGETATASPISLTGLTENTEYTYTLVAVATLNGETFTSSEAKVTFKTPREGVVATSVWRIANGLLNNAYKAGEDPATSRRQNPVTTKAEFVYNTDKTITIHFSISGHEKIVGFVPEVNIAGEYSGSLINKQNEQGVYTWTTTKTFEEGDNIHPYCWYAYDGGVTGVDFTSDFKAGDESGEVFYGEAVRPVLTAPKTIATCNDKTPFVAYLVDEQGNFILSEKPELSLTDNTAAASLDGDFITLAARGAATLVASCGDATAELTFNCYTSAAATNKTDKATITASGKTADEAKLAIDGNEGTELVFNCADTEEHTIEIKLDSVYEVEMIELVWEGASATHYTVTLSVAGTPAARRAAAEPTVFTVTDGEGGAGVTARKYLYNDDLSTIKADNVAINTTKAFDKTWGIKLKEARVYATPATQTGVEAIDVEAEGAVRYFDLRGIEVDAEALTPGLYIRRTATSATKVLVK